MTTDMTDARGLRPVDRGLATLIPADLVPARALYELLYLSDAYVTWRTRGRVITVEDFADLITQTYVASYAVLDPRRDHALVGHVGLYNMDDSSRVASVSAFFDSSSPGADLVAGHALHVLLDRGFNGVGLRKVTFEVTGDLVATMSRSTQWAEVVQNEGVLKSHYLVGGEHRDVELFAIFAKDYLAHYAHIASAPSLSVGRIAYGELTSLICEVAQIDPMDLDGGARLAEDVGLDSLALVELLDRLSDLGVRTSLEADWEVVTVQDVFELVEGARQPVT